MLDNVSLNDQPGNVIERIDEGCKVYFSLEIGRDYGNPAGGWTPEIDKASKFTIEDAQHILDTSLAYNAPFCKVIKL